MRFHTVSYLFESPRIRHLCGNRQCLRLKRKPEPLSQSGKWIEVDCQSQFINLNSCKEPNENRELSEKIINVETITLLLVDNVHFFHGLDLRPGAASLRELQYIRILCCPISPTTTNGRHHFVTSHWCGAYLKLAPCSNLLKPVPLLQQC